MESFPQPHGEENTSEPQKIKSPMETQQEQTDPNLTELKGLVDPKEKLEPEGTDNDV
jgi:hypothetical protein